MGAWGGYWALAGPLVLVATVLATSGLIVLLLPLLHRYALARPNSRSAHRDPTPQGGGMAAIAVLMATMAIALVLSPSLADNAWRPLLWVFGATALLTVVGMVDDIRVLGSVEPCRLP